MFSASYDLADPLNRFISAFIDWFILLLVNAVIGFVLGDLGGYLGVLVGAAYFWYHWTRKEGRTIGKQVMGLKVIKADGTPFTDVDALLRFVGYMVNSFVLLIGWIWIFVDKDNQGWHDKIAKTYVVKA